MSDHQPFLHKTVRLKRTLWTQGGIKWPEGTKLFVASQYDNYLTLYLNGSSAINHVKTEDVEVVND